MRLTSFSIRNYRSITKAHKLPIGDLVVLIGPNNEGKSNILRGLVTALTVLARLRYEQVPSRVRARPYVDRTIYDWERDFPVSLREARPDGGSVFHLEFELTPDELEDFRREVGSKLSGSLPIKLSLAKASFSFAVAKKGPGQKVLSGKQGQIAQFVGKRIDHQYIPAVRTARAALEVVQDLMARELLQVEQDQRFEEALELIDEVQRPILETLSQTIGATLAQFLPEVTKVTVTAPREERYRALRRSCKVLVDDGSATDLEVKGDGVQSLAAISLMRHASEQGARGRQLLLAIEEPESHLHPRAIHELRNVLYELADKHQVIITSHCPLLVDRRDIGRNIIVDRGKAKPAQNIRQLREVLGVRTADNLASAELVLICEGEADRTMVEALLRGRSRHLRNAFDEGLLALDSTAGGGNLPYKLAQIRDGISSAHVYLDDDDAGRQAIERAMAEGLLAATDYHLTVCPDMSQAELEDLMDVAVYSAAVLRGYGVRVEDKLFKSSKRKWSDRMAGTFRAQGKVWNDKVKAAVKSLVASEVAAKPDVALNEHRQSSFEALVYALEERLGAHQD